MYQTASTRAASANNSRLGERDFFESIQLFFRSRRTRISDMAFYELLYREGDV
jgi:hypothetical protein